MNEAGSSGYWTSVKDLQKMEKHLVKKGRRGMPKGEYFKERKKVQN